MPSERSRPSTAIRFLPTLTFSPVAWISQA